jgi:Uma2 family endonuclease
LRKTARGRGKIVPNHRQGRNWLMISEIFRWTPGRFQTAAAPGCFDGSKVELLGGIVYRMTTNPPHMISVHRLVNELGRIAPEPRGVVTKEDNVQLGRWLPLPDSTILRGPIESYSNRLPRAADILLIGEVSDTTYAKDRGRKYRRYAAARIPTYWIVDLNRLCVEVHTSPSGRRYLAEKLYQPGDDVPVLLGGICLGSVAVAAILP